MRPLHPRVGEPGWQLPSGQDSSTWIRQGGWSLAAQCAPLHTLRTAPPSSSSPPISATPEGHDSVSFICLNCSRNKLSPPAKTGTTACVCGGDSKSWFIDTQPIPLLFFSLPHPGFGNLGPSWVFGALLGEAVCSSLLCALRFPPVKSVFTFPPDVQPLHPPWMSKALRQAVGPG